MKREPNKKRADYANIIVISDTHCKSVNDLPDFIIGRLLEATIIIHAGDAQYCSFLTELYKLTGTTIYSVKGNHDENWKTFPLPESLSLEICGFNIGVAHGHKGVGELAHERAMSRFNPDNLDLLIHGHDHRTAGVHRVGSTLVLNPGSPTDTRQPESSIANIQVRGKTDMRIKMVTWINEAELIPEK